MKTLQQHITERLVLSKNKKQYTDGFTENLLYEFYDEDEYNFEKYGEIYYKDNLFGLYRYIFQHNSNGVPIKQLLIMTSPAVYGSIVVKDMTMPCHKLQLHHDSCLPFLWHNLNVSTSNPAEVPF